MHEQHEDFQKNKKTEVIKNLTIEVPATTKLLIAKNNFQVTNRPGNSLQQFPQNKLARNFKELFAFKTNILQDAKKKVIRQKGPYAATDNFSLKNRLPWTKNFMPRQKNSWVVSGSGNAPSA